MPNGVQLHALTHVTGETERLSRPMPPHRAGTLGTRAKRLGNLARQRGDTPVAHDPARGPGDEPESAADHRDAPVLRRAVGCSWVADGSSAPCTTRPGSAPGLVTV